MPTPAYDAGDTPEQVDAVLERYAGTVPQAMTYLVKDAHRRHRPVRVGAATAYIVVDDDGVLQDALLRKGPAAKTIKALGLRRIALAVAVPRGPVAATVEALRALGVPAGAETGGERGPSARGRPDVRAAAAAGAPARPERRGCGPGGGAVARVMQAPPRPVYGARDRPTPDALEGQRREDQGRSRIRDRQAD